MKQSWGIFFKFFCTGFAERDKRAEKYKHGGSWVSVCLHSQVMVCWAWLLLLTHTVSSLKTSKAAMKGTVSVHCFEYKNEGTLFSHHQSALVHSVFAFAVSEKMLWSGRKKSTVTVLYCQQNKPNFTYQAEVH